MTYDIYLTESCNRRCPFCYVKDTGYIETTENIELFMNSVENEMAGKTERIELNLFGGEPFLNFDAIRMICERFKDDWRFDINIISNGDLIEDWMTENISFCHLHLSTYDVFNDEKRSRYLEISKMFRKTTFLYTITSTDMYRFNELRDVYDKMGIEYHIHLSHSPSSWKDVEPEELYNVIYAMANSELERYLKSFSNSNPRGRDFVDQYLLRYISHMSGMDVSRSYCTFPEKKTFYKGRFVGPCIRIEGRKIEYRGKRCVGCKFEKMCQKGCFAEIKDDVDERICVMEKARFSAVADFLESGDQKIPQIEAFYADIARNV